MFNCIRHPQQTYLLVCSNKNCSQYGPLCNQCLLIHDTTHPQIQLQQLLKSSPTGNQQLQIQTLNLLDDFLLKVSERIVEYKRLINEKFICEAKQDQSQVQKAQRDVNQSKNSSEFREKILAFLNQTTINQEQQQFFLSLQYRVNSLLKNLDKLLIEESEQWFESENVLDFVSPVSPLHKTPNESNFVGHHHRARSQNLKVSNHCAQSKILQRDLSPIGIFFSVTKDNQQIQSNYQKAFKPESDQYLISKQQTQSKLDSKFSSHQKEPIKAMKMSQNEQDNFRFISQQSINLTTIHENSILSQSITFKVPQVKRTIFPSGFQTLPYDRLSSMKVHNKSIRQILLLNDNRIATIGVEQNISIWKLYCEAPMEQVAKLIGHTGYTTCLAYNSPMSLIVSGGTDKQINAWQEEQSDYYSLKRTLNDHTDAIRCLRFFLNNTLLASGSYDTTIIIWTMDFKKLIHMNSINQGRISSMISTGKSYKISQQQDSQLIIGCNKVVLFYQFGNYTNPQKILDAHDNLVVTMDLTEPIKQQLDRSITEGLARLKQIKGEGKNNLDQRNRVSVLGGPMDYRTLITGGKDQRIKLWDFETFQHYSTIQLEYTPLTLKYIRTSQMMVVGLCGFEREGKVMIWNIIDKKAPFINCEICDNSTGASTLQIIEEDRSTLLYVGYENKRLECFKLLYSSLDVA